MRHDNTLELAASHRTSKERSLTDPNWHGLIPFHEYFHGDTGAAAGASHQTGWTALVAKLLQQSGEGDAFAG